MAHSRAGLTGSPKTCGLSIRYARGAGLVLATAAACLAQASFAAERSPAVRTNSIGMKMVTVPAGEFQMGSESGDWDEKPVHPVRITGPFEIGATEVTNVQYERFAPAHRKLRGKMGFSKADDEAVVFVSWHEAVAFCKWLSKKEGKPYRLATEAEWEYACRAETTTPYHTGKSLPTAYQKNAKVCWYASGRVAAKDVVGLHVGKTPPNAWGLHDMHGNVEEWCGDWYGPYTKGDPTCPTGMMTTDGICLQQANTWEDPVGYADGDFKVTRGGSHSTTSAYLRSANRAGTLPTDRSWLIGFRVVRAATPKTSALPAPPAPLHRRQVKQTVPPDLARGPAPAKPYFAGPKTYVKIPAGSDGPLFSCHNHCPALINCPNGDLLAIWYTCRTEPGRELDIAASRLPYGADEWQPASWFWGAPDRNDHASALWVNEKGVLHHFNGLSAQATWGPLATIMRTSADSGRTWSKARLIMPDHGPRHMPIETVFRLADGTILLPCDAVPGGSGGSVALLSRDDGRTWIDPAAGRPTPSFKKGTSGHAMAGIHAGAVQLADGRLMAFGRSNNIDGRMPMSLSTDGGGSWTYHPSPWDGLGGGQRLVVLRLRSSKAGPPARGPILFCSFARQMALTDAAGKQRNISGLFAALSYDEGKTWPARKLISDYGPPRRMDGGGNTRTFTMSATTGEPRGYLSVCQTADGLVHLISSKLHYTFNQKWVETPMPPMTTERTKATP